MKRTKADPHFAIGARLKERRLLLNLSQEDVGNAMGISLSQVARYESGENQADMPMLFRFCDALQCDVSDLLTDFIGRETPVPMTPVAIEIAQMVDKLKDEKCRGIARKIMSQVLTLDQHYQEGGNGR